MVELRLALIGFGSVGREFCRILQDNKDQWCQEFGCQLLITAITTASRGSLYSQEGIDIERALQNIEKKGVFDPANPDYSKIDSLKAAADPVIDILLEVSTLNIENGKPAYDHIKTALKAGKDVVTANKGPVAHHYRELIKLAESQGLSFYFEGTVMDCTPIFNLVRETLPGVKIKSFEGILNSTTNFIISAMEKGQPFDSALMEAKKLGFVEADPSLDIEGWDAAVKTAVLLNVLLGADCTPAIVERRGIAGITVDDINSAGLEGMALRLVCEGGYDDCGKPYGKAILKKVLLNDDLARVKGTSSILKLKTDLAGELAVSIYNPTVRETAYALTTDLLNICRKCNN